MTMTNPFKSVRATQTAGARTAWRFAAVPCFLLATGLTSVRAQDSGPIASEAEPKDSVQLEEVTVTATRREESIEKVPISVSALTGQDLERAGIKELGDIAAVTPGLQFTIPGQSFSTINVVSIRGLNTLGGASVVGIYLDDTPIQGRLSPVGNVGTPLPILFDLNRVEVERGPQGTLFGAGSEAGTIRFIANEPSLSKFEGSTSAEISSTDGGGASGEAGAAIGGPIIPDVLGFRLSVWARHDGGYIDQESPITQEIVARNVNTDNKLAARAALAIKPVENVTITPSVYFQSIRSGDGGRFYGLFSDAANGVFNDGPLAPEIVTDQFVLPSVKVSADLGFAELTGIVSYYHRTLNLNTDLSAFAGAVGLINYGSPLGPEYATSPNDIAPDPTGQTARATTEEIRLASTDPHAFLTWIAGIFNDHRAQDDWQYLYSGFIDPTQPMLYSAHQNIVDQQTAIFAQGDFHLTHKATVTLGARVAKVKTDQSNAYGDGILNAGVPPISYSEDRESPVTPRFSFSYQATKDHMLYTSITKGFRIGGGNGELPDSCNTVTPQSYSSDYVWNYEVGAKNRFLDGRLQVDTSVFHLRWSNIQQLIPFPCGLQYTANAGAAVSNGFDLAIRAMLTEHLQWSLTTGYSNAHYTKTVLDPAGDPVASAGDRVGSLPTVSPPWDVDTFAYYRIPVPTGQDVYLRGEEQYHSKNPGPFINQNPLNPAYLPLAVATPATHLFNARLGVLSGRLDVSLFVNNLFNSHPLLAAQQFSPTSSLLTYSSFRPRTVGLFVSAKLY
jgi:outer membrane receptor protein involved in Fe transport